MEDSSRTVLSQGARLENILGAHGQTLQDINNTLKDDWSENHSRKDGLQNLISSTAASSRTLLSRYPTSQQARRMMSAVVRQEIEKILDPIADAISQMQHRNEDIAVFMERVAEDLAWQVSSGPIETQPQEVRDYELRSELSSKEEVGGHIETTIHESPPYGSDHNDDSICDPYSNPRYAIAYQPGILTRIRANPVVRSRKYFNKIPYIGTVTICIKSFNKRWNSFSNTLTSDTSILVEFWPSWPLFCRRRIALLYSTELSHNAYFQIFPVIAMFPVLLWEDPLWKLVSNENLFEDFRHALQTGVLRPDHQDERGTTMLHVRSSLR